LSLDLEKLAEELNAVVIPTSAATGEGVSDLVSAIKREAQKNELPNIVLPPNYQKLFRSPSYVNGIFRDIDLLLKEITLTPLKPDNFSERVDHLILHPVFGVVILMAILILVFQTLFTWAEPLMDLIEGLFG